MPARSRIVPVDPPAVTIVLATYNRETLLPRCIDSVRAQDLRQWELIVVDDGSTDRTVDVVADYMLRDARIRRRSIPHAGPGTARNRGLADAAGTFVTFIDSDDEYRIDHLSRRVAFMSAHPAIALVHGGAVVVGGDNDRLVPDARDLSRMIDIADCAVGGTFFARRGVIEAAGGWEDSYAEDFRLLERIARQGAVARVDIPTYLYHRDAPDSRCSDMRRER